MPKLKKVPKELAATKESEAEHDMVRMRNLLARGAEEIRTLRQLLAVAEAKVSTMDLFRLTLITQVPNHPMGYQDDITYQMEGFSKVIRK